MHQNRNRKEGIPPPPPPLQPMNYLAAVLKDAQILPTLTKIFGRIGQKIHPQEQKKMVEKKT